MSEQVDNARILIEHRNELRMKINLHYINGGFVETKAPLIDDDSEEIDHIHRKLESIDWGLTWVLRHLVDVREPLRLVGFHDGTHWTEEERTEDGKRTTSYMPKLVDLPDPSEFPHNVLVGLNDHIVHVAPHPVGREPGWYSPDNVKVIKSYVVPIDNIVSISVADPERAVN